MSILPFLTAIFFGLHTILVKFVGKQIRPSLIPFFMILLPLPLYVILFAMEGMPLIRPPFFYSLLVTIIGNLFGLYFYSLSLSYTDISIAAPLLSLSPLFLLLTSFVILGEFPSKYGIYGIILVTAGCYFLGINENNLKKLYQPFVSLFKNKGARLAIITSFIWSITANFDKKALLNSSPVFFLLCFSLVYIPLYILFLQLVLKQKLELKFPQKIWVILVIFGLLEFGVAYTQMNALKSTITPYVIAIKRAGLILPALFGWLVLKEPNPAFRLIGTILTILGLFFITL